MAAPQRNLDPELILLMDLTVNALDKDVALKGKTVSLGAFGSLKRVDSQYGPELRRLFDQALRSRIKDRVVSDGTLNLVVNYDLVDSMSDTVTLENNTVKMRVLQITATIFEDSKEQFKKSVEVNDTVDIGRVLGLTFSPPPSSQDERNKTIRDEEARTKGKQANEIPPSFQVQKGSRIGNLGDDKFFVEILVKDKADGPTTAIKPTANERGNAFVDLKPGQFYEILIHNNDKFDCIAFVTIDGQDAANRFNADGVKYLGLAVAPGKSGLLKGWLHTTKPNQKDNVFAFAVKEYFEGAGKDLPKPTEVGVITVQFALAWEKGKPQPKPTGRHTGNYTDKGASLPENFKVVEYEHSAPNETISIRYSRTAK